MLGIAISRIGSNGDFDDAERDLLNQARPFRKLGVTSRSQAAAKVWNLAGAEA
jgi:hypothetical protein